MSELLSTTPELMTECCDDEEGIRYDITKPFVEGDYLVATNGQIAVRRLASDFDPGFLASLMDSSRKLPKTQLLWDATDHELVPLPDAAEKVPCDGCKGKEFTSCWECYGVRFERNLARVTCGPRDFAAHWVGMLRRHGVTEIGVSRKLLAPGWFSVGRFEGLLMPLEIEEPTP